MHHPFLVYHAQIHKIISLSTLRQTGAIWLLSIAPAFTSNYVCRSNTMVNFWFDIDAPATLCSTCVSACIHGHCLKIQNPLRGSCLYHRLLPPSLLFLSRPSIKYSVALIPVSDCPLPPFLHRYLNIEL
jgi:hypothetical protein